MADGPSRKRSYIEDDDQSNMRPPQKRVRFPKGKKVKTGDYVVDDQQEKDGPVRLQDPQLVAKERRKHRSQMAADLLDEENRGMLPDITKAEVQYEDDEIFVDDGIPIEPFNLTKEREGGYFDAAGNYVEFLDNESEIKDAWLDSIDAYKSYAASTFAASKNEDDVRDLSSDDFGKIKRHISVFLNQAQKILYHIPVPGLALLTVLCDKMAGAAAARSFTDARTCPCLCLDPMISSSLSVKTNMGLVLYKDSSGRRNLKKLKSVDLGSSFLDTRSTERLSCGAQGCRKKKKKLHHLRVVDELGGQYEEGFDDVKNEIINYLTYKAVRTVLNQLYEMNPPQYMWFHNFVAENVPNTGKGFLQKLAKEKQDLAERVMITRLHLYGKWIKICDHAEMYKEISDENLALMRERLMETVIWPSDETDTEKTG